MYVDISSSPVDYSRLSWSSEGLITAAIHQRNRSITLKAGQLGKTEMTARYKNQIQLDHCHLVLSAMCSCLQ